MSDNVNKDIQNAINSAQRSENSNGGNSTVNIPDPRILQHSLNQSKANIPAPNKLKEGNGSK